MNFLEEDFQFAEHTLIVSDIHLADAEKNSTNDALWKRFKKKKHFIDRDFSRFLEMLDTEITEVKKSKKPIELVLNGDIFDFDSVMTLPSDKVENRKFDEFQDMELSWLEKMRGLLPEEEKSLFKMRVMLEDHPDFVQALKRWIQKGNRILFVIGNHDLELQWPMVQEEILQTLVGSSTKEECIRFCEWFYVSNKDTLIEHGNQYDAYCLSSNPVNPLVRSGSRVFMRISFGNLASRFMINGMGFMNPHSGTFLKESLWEYVRFYYTHIIRVQPFILWDWLWGACVTLAWSVLFGFLPALSDPLTIDVRLRDIARKANSDFFMVLRMKEIQVHPAIFSPLKILRELWLDRFLLLFFLFYISIDFATIIAIWLNISFWWFVVFFLMFLPLFVFYARSVDSEVMETQEAAFRMAPLASRLVSVSRLVHGHTHIAMSTMQDGIQVINTGTWSPAFHDVECTQPFGKKYFAWIQPGVNGERGAELYEWHPEGFEVVVRDKI